jgi:hypothetical protein
MGDEEEEVGKKEMFRWPKFVPGTAALDVLGGYNAGWGMPVGGHRSRTELGF